MNKDSHSQRYGRGLSLWGLLEVVFLTGLTLLICHYINPANPFFIKEIFPWPWLAAIIAVLQYGFGAGVISGFIITAAVLYRGPSGALEIEIYQHYLLSGFILILTCSLFSSSLIRRVTNAEELRIYAEERLGNLSRSYHLLHLSYHYLEQDLIIKPITLRSTMLSLQEMIVSHHGVMSKKPAHRFLQLISQYCSASVSGIYWLEGKAIQIEPLEQIGNCGPLDMNDPLIKEAFKANKILHVETKQEELNESAYLIAVPMRDEQDKLIGMIVIKEMPFWYFNDDTLRALGILVDYFNQSFVVATHAKAIFEAYPDCPSHFAKEFKKLHYLKKMLNIDSALVAIIVTKALRPYNVIYHLQSQQRTLDSSWTFALRDYDIFITLMPFAHAPGIRGYLSRIDNYLKEHLGFRIEQKDIRSRSLQLNTKAPAAILDNFMMYIQDAINGE